MRFVMNPDMVYQYPIWGVGLLLVGAAVFGALLLELCAWRLLPIELRQRHNDVTAAIFSAIGVTYAVLLAFVANLAWEGFIRSPAD
jgi:drug/metabolite transporter (DMT)-like permease